MNVKEYLATNKAPFLTDELNSFVLLWIEKEGETNSEELVENIGLPRNVLNDVLKKLFDSNLIQLNNSKYRISKSGGKLLQKIGLSDILLEYLLSELALLQKEKNIYQKLFSSYRDNFFELYLNMLNMYKKMNKYGKNAREDNYNSYSTHFYIICFILCIADTLNSSDEQKSIEVINHYIELEKFSKKHTCKSQTAFNYLNKEDYILKIDMSSFPKDIVTKHDHLLHKSKLGTHYYSCYNALKADSSFIQNMYIQDNKDFSSTVLLSFMDASTVDSLALKLNISCHQAKLLLAFIKSKSENLLQSKQ